MIGRVSYLVSVCLASILLVAGLYVYERASKLPGFHNPRVGWHQILPTVAMAYGSLLLLAVAVIEVRVRHIKAGSLVVRTRTLDELVAHLTSCMDEERREWSVRLHDDVGGLLAALKMEIEVMPRAPAQQLAWQRVDGLLANLFAEVRSLSASLYPRMIGSVGLERALKELVERMNGSRMNVTLHIDGSIGDVEKEASLGVYRIVQEALVNAGRHADAVHVRVQLARTEHELIGSVEDDGRGWGASSHGMGLTLMGERARALNGSLEFGIADKGGARVTFQIPLRARHMPGRVAA